MNRLVEWLGLRAARDRAIENATLDRAAAKCKEIGRFYGGCEHGATVAAGAWSCHEAILRLKKKGDNDGNG